MVKKTLPLPQGILWDLDNTLYRLDDTVERAVNLAVARAAIALGADLSLDEATILAHQSWLKYRHSAREFITRYNIAFADIHHETDRMLSGTLVEKCHITRDLFASTGLDHALITHAARPWALRTLDHLELKPWFPDAQIFAYENFDFQSKAKSRKPFEMALASINQNPGNVLMVEDTFENLRVPQEMGMTTIYLHHGQVKLDLPDYVDFSFANAKELLTQIEVLGHAALGASKAFS